MSHDEESSIRLLQRARAGDREAMDRLCGRYIPPLRRWASGRLPRRARDILDTEDLIQETVMKTLAHIASFEPQHHGALHAYLRRAVLNRVRDELRRVDRRPGRAEIQDEHPDPAPSPLDEAIGADMVARYERALERLRPEDREAVLARIEMDCSYEHIAIVLDKSSVDAARMAVARALVRLAEEMGLER